MAKQENLGIDLGTSNTSVCFFNREQRAYDYLRFDENRQNYFPSMITYRPDEDRPLIGFRARKMMHTKGSRYFLGREIKLRMGKDEVVRGRTVMDILTDQLAAILTKFHEERNATPGKIVLTVPAKWMEKRGTRKELMMLEQAFQTLGFDKSEVTFESEPVAAAAYFYHELMKDSFTGYCLVVDYGGGTLDASLIYISEEKEIKVVYTTGVTGEVGIGCAGEAFDREICCRMIERNDIEIPQSARDQNGKLDCDSKWFLKLMRDVEAGKISDSGRTTRALKAYYAAYGQERQQLRSKIAFEVTDAEDNIYEVTVGEVVDAFEKVNLPFLKNLLEEILSFCKTAGIVPCRDTFYILPTGGFSQLYCVDVVIRQILGETYGNNPLNLLDRDARITAIAHGAAILSDRLLSVVPVCRQDVGIVFYDTSTHDSKRSVLLHKNTPARDCQKPVFMTSYFESAWMSPFHELEIFSGDTSHHVAVGDLCPLSGKEGTAYWFGLALVDQAILLYSRDRSGTVRMKSLEYILG